MKTKPDWEARGFTCELWVDPPGQVWPDFIHDVDEVVMVADGVVEFEFDGCRVRPAPGEEVLIPARAVHTVRNVGSTPARWYFGYRRR